MSEVAVGYETKSGLVASEAASSMRRESWVRMGSLSNQGGRKNVSGRVACSAQRQGVCVNRVQAGQWRLLSSMFREIGLKSESDGQACEDRSWRRAHAMEETMIWAENRKP